MAKFKRIGTLRGTSVFADEHGNVKILQGGDKIVISREILAEIQKLAPAAKEGAQS